MSRATSFTPTVRTPPAPRRRGPCGPTRSPRAARRWPAPCRPCRSRPPERGRGRSRSAQSFTQPPHEVESVPTTVKRDPGSQRKPLVRARRSRRSRYTGGWPGRHLPCRCSQRGLPGRARGWAQAGCVQGREPERITAHIEGDSTRAPGSSRATATAMQPLPVPMSTTTMPVPGPCASSPRARQGARSRASARGCLRPPASPSPRELVCTRDVGGRLALRPAVDAVQRHTRPLHRSPGPGRSLPGRGRRRHGRGTPLRRPVI